MRAPYINKKSPSITPRESDGFKLYLKELSKIPILTTDEEIELFEQIKLGDVSARDKIIKHNLRFVVSVANKYYSNSLIEKTYQFSDIVQEGNYGLVKAIERYDSTKGFKFISFAVWPIMNYIYDFTARTKAINLPPSVINKIRKINEKLRKEESAKGCFLYFDEIIYGMNFGFEELKVIRDVNYFNNENNRVKLTDEIPDTLSFYDSETFLNDEEKIENRYIDKIADQSEFTQADYVLQKESLNINLARALSTLTSREQDIICMHFGLFDQEEMTFKELGVKFNLTTERVRAIREKAIRRLKHSSRSNIILHGNWKTNTSNIYTRRAAIKEVIEEISKKGSLNSDGTWCYCASCGKDFYAVLGTIKRQEVACPHCESEDYEITEKNNLKLFT